MRVYIAAPYTCKPRATQVRDQLVAAGHHSTSRWLDAPSDLNAAWACADLDDVRDAEVLVALNEPEYHTQGTGGRHTELGFALAWDKRIYLVGERSQIFHYHPNVRQIASVEELVRVLREREQESRTEEIP